MSVRTTRRGFAGGASGAAEVPPDGMSAPSSGVNASLSMDGVVMGQRPEVAGPVLRFNAPAWRCSASWATAIMVCPSSAHVPAVSAAA